MCLKRPSKIVWIKIPYPCGFHSLMSLGPTQSHGNTWHCHVTLFNLFIRDLGHVISFFSGQKHTFFTHFKKRWSSYLFSRRGLPTEQRTCIKYISELSQFLKIKGESRNDRPKAIILLEMYAFWHEKIEITCPRSRMNRLNDVTWQCHVFPWDWVVYVYVCLCMRVCMYVSVCVCVCVYSWICIRLCPYVCGCVLL